MIDKILLYYPSFERGGAEKNLINIVNYFTKKKIKIFLFSHNVKKEKFYKSNYLKIIRSQPLKNMNFIPIRWNLALSAALNLNYYAKKFNRNSIIFSMQSHIPSIIVAKLNKKKISIRNSEEPLGATYYADNRLIAFFVLILKFIFYNFSNQIIAISKKSEQSLKKIVFFNRKVTLILNPYLANIYKKKKMKKEKRKFSILSVGRITKQKNLDLLINSFLNLSKKYKNIELTIIGDGDLFTDINNRVSTRRNIRLIKWKKNLRSFFLKSDLFILSSFYEGLPNVLIDAVNYEVPCIATNVSGVKDILINGKGGLIIPNNDQQELEKNIEYSLKHYSKIKKKVLLAKKKLFRFTNINCVLMHRQFDKLNSLK